MTTGKRQNWTIFCQSFDKNVDIWGALIKRLITTFLLSIPQQSKKHKQKICYKVGWYLQKVRNVATSPPPHHIPLKRRVSIVACGVVCWM